MDDKHYERTYALRLEKNSLREFKTFIWSNKLNRFIVLFSSTETK